MRKAIDKHTQASLDAQFVEKSDDSKLAQQLPNTCYINSIAKANVDNALAIIVPCHRIIDPAGSIIGYGGGLELKKRLLELENNLLG
ncbi:methylated-DNA--[protein]-cysteine S-methyltransferase [Pseudoalteromonas sp. MSK9-3]|uniref:methylated-DNA--[protein]-cysteine S-methyltransferase n=1 Tax=Pseudoalteromonas sp. MSK9-3 TaxID=1897633 RepID=UPI002175DFF1|nr:methylated-DNA--[protein]-cysteine S-methyltransferase [Pseudoalteromonas sp. MSK9-3]